MRLNAIISTAPKTDVVERAKQLDSERLQKGSRGSPMIVKVHFSSVSEINVLQWLSGSQDLICTPSLGMKTTCGSLAFKDLNAAQDANMIEMLQRAGAIIIGKANLLVLYMQSLYEIRVLNGSGNGQYERGFHNSCMISSRWTGRSRLFLAILEKL